MAAEDGRTLTSRVIAIDVVKTRIQIDPALARHTLFSGGRKIIAAEGPKVSIRPVPRGTEDVW